MLREIPMKRIVLTLGLLLVVAPLALADSTWEQVSSDDGITTWRKDVEGSSLVAFRGEAVIDAPIAKVARVLDDATRELEWVSDALEVRVVRDISPVERVEYNRTHAPWPVKDRDFVFHAQMAVDPETQTVVYRLRSVKDDRAPEDEDKAVRGELEQSCYVLKSLDTTHTRLTVEIQADPKGSVPKWVVNLVQRSWPRKTIQGIRTQAAKADVTELAFVKTALAPQPAGVAVAAVTSQVAK
jgi:hypothetical protein